VSVATKRSGHLIKSVTVYTNILKRNKTIRLTIQGEVWQPVVAKPQSVNFGRMSQEKAQNATLVRKITIVNNTESDATLTNVRSSLPLFQAKTRVLEPGKKFELTVSVTSSLRPGYNRGKIDMSTGLAEMPTLSVPVSAYLLSDVEVNPNRLMLRPGRLNMKRQFTVRNNTRKPLKISDLKASNPALQVSLQETKPGTIFRITVDVPAGYKVPSGGDKITFNTNSPNVPEVTIPITETNYARRPGISQTNAFQRTRSPSGGRKLTPPRTPARTGSKAAKKPATGKVRPKGATPVGG